jgi:hypothetical protein
LTTVGVAFVNFCIAVVILAVAAFLDWLLKYYTGQLSFEAGCSSNGTLPNPVEEWANRTFTGIAFIYVPITIVIPSIAGLCDGSCR